MGCLLDDKKKKCFKFRDLSFSFVLFVMMRGALFLFITLFMGCSFAQQDEFDYGGDDTEIAELVANLDGRVSKLENSWPFPRQTRESGENYKRSHI